MRKRGYRVCAIVVLVGAALLATSAGCAQRPSGPAGLRAILQDWRERSGAPGVVLAVRGPGLTWTGSAGIRRPGDGPAVTVHSHFRVASITKMFVATVVLQLADEHRLGLDDRLSAYVPDFPGAQRISLRQLLDHTSGVPDYTQTDGWNRRLLEDRNRSWRPVEVLAVAADREPEFEPGADYAYCNTDYVLLGEVIRVVTDNLWTEEVRRRILDPLRLSDTYVPGEPARGVPEPAVVAGWFDVDGDGAQENVETGGPWRAQDTSEGAAGALVSTAGDLLDFGDALFHGRLVSDSALTAMTAEGPHHPRFSNYGLGIEIRRPDYRTTTWGHGGFLPGFRSALRYLPDEDLLVVVLTNDSQADPDDLAELAYRSVKTQRSP